MNTMDFPPTSYEIRNQLERMLASARFKNASNPAAFLALVVERKLKGKKTPGRVIAETLFKEKFVKLVSNDVRTTASNLRKALARYYEQEGNTDLVIIRLPEPPKDRTIKAIEGEAYTPVVEYNPAIQNQIFIRLGYRILENATYSDFLHAHRIFSDILQQEPDDIGASLGLVETVTKLADRNWKHPADPDPRETCNSLLDRMKDRSADYWRFWATRAYAEMVLGDDGEAAILFEKSLAFDRRQTETYVPYIDFMLDTKQLKKGIGLANRYLNAHLEESAAHAHFARFLAKSGQVETALRSLETAIVIDAGNRAAHELLAVMLFVKGELERAETHLRILRSICDPASFNLLLKSFEQYEDKYALKGWAARLLPAKISVSSGPKSKS